MLPRRFKTVTFPFPMKRLWSASLATLFFSFHAFAAQSFPKPDPEQSFSELKVFDSSGRPWRAAREDWDGAKKRVIADPAWSKWLKQQQSSVDGWMAAHHDRVEWKAGWSHDGVSPKDGSRVTWTDKIPREEVPYFSSP